MRYWLAMVCIMAMFFCCACSSLLSVEKFEQMTTTQVPQQTSSIPMYANDKGVTPEVGTEQSEAAQQPNDKDKSITSALVMESEETTYIATTPTSTPALVIAEELHTDAMEETPEPSSTEAPIDRVRRIIQEDVGVSDDSDNYEIYITFETDVLYSCIAVVEYTDGKERALKPFTIAKQEGRICRLSDFFSTTNTGWKSKIPDMVTKSALERGMTLLCDVPPISGDQLFYVQGGDIVLVYRPYEIATYDAGWPSFSLSMQELQEYTTGAYGIGGNE